MDLKMLSETFDRICRICLKICDRDNKTRSVFGELEEQEIFDDNLFFVYEILCSVTSMQVSFMCFYCFRSTENNFSDFVDNKR